MKPYLMLPLALAGTLGLYGSVPEQKAELPNFRIVDLDRIVEQSRRFAGDRERFQKRLEERERELTALRDEYRDLERQIQDIADPGDPKRVELTVEWGTKKRQFELQKDASDALTESERRKALILYYEEIARACEAYAKEKELDAIFRSWSLDSEPNANARFNLVLTRYHLYYSKRLDVTEEIVKRIDSQ